MQLTEEHATARLNFAGENINRDWQNVIFTDEKIFSTSDDSPKVLWRKNNTRYDVQHIQPTRRSGRISCGFWGWMSAVGPNEIVPVDGRFTAEQYEDILEDTFIPSARVFFPEGPIYMVQDNSPIHTARLMRREAYKQFHDKFAFLTDTVSISSSSFADSKKSAEELIASYPKDIEADFIQEFIHFREHVEVNEEMDITTPIQLLKWLRQEGMQSVHPNVDIALRICVYCPAKPGKPQLIADVDGTPDVITIRWDRPVKDGGSPITGYLVEHRRTGSPHWVRATPLLVPFPELTLSGLEPGWRYQFRDNHRRSDRSVLTIHQSQLVDSGEIRCSATNKAGHATTTALLTLEAPPTIRLPRQYEEGLLFEIGEVIRLKISVAGLPVPLVLWSHNGETIHNSERYEIENFDNSTTLRIAEAKRADRGEYQVKAINKLGQDQASFLVTVTDKPSPPGKAKVLMTLGKSVTLAWNTPEDDGGCKIGNYIVEYYRLGWNVWLKAATSRQLNAVLGDLIEDKKRGILEPQPRNKKRGILEPQPRSSSQPREIPVGRDPVPELSPDKKRGILEPQPRSSSQPREIPVGRDPVPELPQRKSKPRSQSSSRAEDHRVQFNIPNGVPVRPERKLKSPQRTPEASPRVVRRELNPETINKSIFDRSSITRDLSYGTPEFKIVKVESEEMPTPNVPVLEILEVAKPRSTIQIIDNKRPRSTSPMLVKSSSPTVSPVQNNSQVDQSYQLPPSKSPTPEKSFDRSRRSRSPTPQRLQLHSQDRTPSPVQNTRLQSTRSPSPNFARKASKDYNGSSEFMLVLLPNESKEREAMDIDISFDENQII
ncbi:Fibronectin type III domain [Popillia japonica]|uniref:Fibronectin type III domain n=1 Tax=Popillia japonica TaxID=7064 RepID=A0AAW1IZD9_POPJA